jgi:hypothetical protein
LKYADFRAFVIWATHPEFNPTADTFLLYKKDDVRDAPAPVPLSPHYYRHADQIFPAVDGQAKYFLYALFVPGLAPEEYERSLSVLVQLSVNAQTIARTAVIFLPRGSTFPALAARVRELAVLPPDAPVRAHLVRAALIAEEVAEEAKLEDRTTVRFEVVPEDQRELAAGDALIQVALAVVSSVDYLVVEKVPCLVRVRADATLADVRGVVLAALGVEAESATKAKFFLGRQWVRFTPAMALRDENRVVTTPADALHVVLGGKGPAAARRRAEEGIKIHN